MPSQPSRTSTKSPAHTSTKSPSGRSKTPDTKTQRKSVTSTAASPKVVGKVVSKKPDMSELHHVKTPNTNPHLKGHKDDKDDKLIKEGLAKKYEEVFKAKSGTDKASLEKLAGMMGCSKSAIIKDPPKDKKDFANGALIGRWNKEI